jgi:hypothetical protein
VGGWGGGGGGPPRRAGAAETPCAQVLVQPRNAHVTQESSFYDQKNIVYHSRYARDSGVPEDQRTRESTARIIPTKTCNHAIQPSSRSHKLGSQNLTRLSRSGVNSGWRERRWRAREHKSRFVNVGGVKLHIFGGWSGLTS